MHGGEKLTNSRSKRRNGKIYVRRVRAGQKQRVGGGGRSRVDVDGGQVGDGPGHPRGRGIPGAGAARGRRRTAAAASGLSPDPGLTPVSFPKGLTAPRMQATLRRNPTTLGLCVLLGAAEKRDVFPFCNTPERRRGRAEQNTVSRFFFWQDRLISFSEEG